MTRFGLAITCAVAIGVFLVAALLLREDHLTPEKLEKRLEIYRTRGWLSRPRSIAEGARAQQIEDTYLTNCLHKLGTLRNDARSIRINEPIDEHRINIFFIGSDPNGWFGDFRGNCAYTGHKNIIICDLEFFERVRSVPDWYGDVAKKLGPLLVSDTMLELSRSTLGILALWLIGHEIGHIAYGDASAHFDFHRPSKPIAFPETLSEKEKRCDAFAVLAANETLRDHLQFGLYEVIGYELGRLRWETGQTIPDTRLPELPADAPRFAIHAERQGHHPPRLIRAIDMLILSLEMTSEGDPVLLEKELAKYRRLRQLVEIQK